MNFELIKKDAEVKLNTLKKEKYDSLVDDFKLNGHTDVEISEFEQLILMESIFLSHADVYEELLKKYGIEVASKIMKNIY